MRCTAHSWNTSVLLRSRTVRRGARCAAVGTLLLGAPLAASRAATCDAHSVASRSGGVRARPNDNRVPSGTFRDNVLRVSVVARAVVWYPDGPRGCALAVHAFAEEGQDARIPGPLIRVKAGTEVHVAVRNALDMPLWVRGLQDRSGGLLDSTEIAPGDSHEFRFRATVPGAWYYWAGASGRTDAHYPTSTDDGQLLGALVVDSAEGQAPDRVFVMTRWTPRGIPGNADVQVNAINGQTWPNTERVAYTVGDSVRWQVINASDELHMMHLHGFYYRVENRGDAAHDSVLARQRKSSVVTVATRRGEWMSIAWSPDRTGNWLFHCHIVAHISGGPNQSHADGTMEHHGPRTPASRPSSSMSMDDMTGLVLGVTVHPRPGAALRTKAVEPARRLQLYANMRARTYGERPGYGFVLQEDTRPPAPDSLRVPGTPLVVTQGEPLAITLHNRTTSTFGIHWHGIELESYFDGVAGWSGMARHVAPHIAPGDSFVARFTPPRAGTFIYHVHNEPGDELASGLYGPLLVLAPGARFDPHSDRLVVIASGGPGIDPPTAINGKIAPDTMSLTFGNTNRLRFIDITSNEAHVVELRGPVGRVAGSSTWRPLARDGMDLPADQQVAQPARMNTAAGITADVEFTPAEAGDYSLVFTSIVAGRLAGQTSMPIHVRVP